MPVIVSDALVKYGMAQAMLDALPRIYKTLDRKTDQDSFTLINDIGEVVTITAGQLERLLHLCGEQADHWFVDIQRLILNVLDIDECRSDYLPFIASMLNADLSPFSSDRNWREHLKSQIEILRTRGTARAVENFIKFYVGWTATVVRVTQVGFGAGGFGVPGFGSPGSPTPFQYQIRFEAGSGAQLDPKQAEKLTALQTVLPNKYIPVGITFELVVV